MNGSPGSGFFLKGISLNKPLIVFKYARIKLRSYYLIVTFLIFSQVYDIDADGYLTKSDMFQLLKSSLRPAFAKALPFKGHGIHDQITPTVSPRPSALVNEDAKEIEMDVFDDDDTKPIG